MKNSTLKNMFKNSSKKLTNKADILIGHIDYSFIANLFAEV